MLKDIVLETEVIRYRKVEFTVSGISVDDVSALLVRGERDQLEVAFEEISNLYESAQVKGKKAQDNKALEAGLTKIILRLPALAAKCIAIAAGEPEHTDTVRKLPLPVQLQALMAIGRLTFDGEDSVRNFVDGLTTLLTQIRKTATMANGAMSPVLAHSPASTQA